MVQAEVMKWLKKQDRSCWFSAESIRNYLNDEGYSYSSYQVCAALQSLFSCGMIKRKFRNDYSWHRYYSLGLRSNKKVKLIDCILQVR